MPADWLSCFPNKKIEKSKGVMEMIQAEERIKGCKSIAEYAIRQYLIDQGCWLAFFDLNVCGNEGTLTDRSGDSLVLVYDNSNKSVRIKAVLRKEAEEK